LFRERLISLVCQWMRVGYCQGNFNSDNCAAGGFTLDYGPFGFCELFDPRFQPWTGGGIHFSFFNQPKAAETNYRMFWSALSMLLQDHPAETAELDALHESFSEAMQRELDAMWAGKIGLASVTPELIGDLLELMVASKADYTIVFRELASLPKEVTPLKRGFYVPSDVQLDAQWNAWLTRWHQQLSGSEEPEEIAASMRRANPAITWREWLIAPAYEQAARSDYSLVHELQTVFLNPYEPLSAELAARYDQLRPREFFGAGGISHYSCSS